MAKTKDLESAINELRENYRKVLRQAVQYATEEAEKDVHQRALSCLEEYYSNYEPNSYNRSDSLRHAFLPYKSVKSNGHYLISTVGIEYNASALEAYAPSSYNASKKYDGRVDTEWVIDNYLEGIHPTTNGSKIPENVEYIPIYDSESPTQKMGDYLNSYAHTFSENVYSYLAAYVARAM